MRRIITISFFLLILFIRVFSQEKIDTIFMKTGEILKGEIVENVLNDFVKIRFYEGPAKIIKYWDIDRLAEGQKNKSNNGTQISIDTEKIIKQNKRCNIYFKNGDMVIGKIIKSNMENDIQVEFEAGSIIIYQMKDISKIEVIPIKIIGSIGAGYGIPYGVLGLNLDLSITPSLNVSFGIGTTLIAGVGYSIGSSIYFTDIDKSWRPRISVYYGTNGVLIYGSKNEVGSGLTFGLGQKWMWGNSRNHGLDLDLMIIATSGIYDRADELKKQGWTVEEAGRIKVSMGYRYAF